MHLPRIQPYRDARRELAQREADERADREAKEALHRRMADYWIAGGWPLDADDDDA